MNISDMIREINEYQSKINRFSDLFCERLAKEAQGWADVYYRWAEYAGVNDVKVSVERNGDASYMVKANGKAVLFIEFGTGITKADAPQERDIIIEGDVLQHGEYGKGLGSHPKGWTYKGYVGDVPPKGTFQRRDSDGLVLTHGNNATPAMYNARKKIIDIYKDVAKEVWGNM